MSSHIDVAQRVANRAILNTKMEMFVSPCRRTTLKWKGMVVSSYNILAEQFGHTGSSRPRDGEVLQRACT